MTFVYLLPVILATLTLLAHFLRTANLFAIAFCIAVLIALFFRQRWIPRAVQLFLILAALEWIRTLFELKATYAEQDRDPARMMRILIIVASITLASALIFEIPRVKRFYQNPQP